MKKIIFFIFISISVFSQNERSNNGIAFSEMISNHYLEFQRDSSIDYDKNSKESFKSLVNQKLKGTILDNLKVYSINKRINYIYQLKKPIYLMSYSSWCVPSNGELEALEIIIDEHSTWIDFVLIMWDNKKDALKFSKQFHPNTIVLYVNELDNIETKTIKILKHKLGIPMTYVISSDKTILDIRQNTQVHPSVDNEIATKICFKSILKDIKKIQDYETR